MLTVEHWPPMPSGGGFHRSHYQYTPMVDVFAYSKDDMLVLHTCTYMGCITSS